MTFATGHSIPQTEQPRSPRETLPTMYDLPSEFPEEPGLPDEFHDFQPQLLSRTLSLDACAADNRFTGSDINLYYDVHHPLWHERSDWFLALNVPRLYDGHDLRRSYVVWQEGQALTIVVEFLSPKTEREDLGRFYGDSDRIEESETAEVSQNGANQRPPGKLAVYEQYLRVPHYLVYSRYTKRLRYFKLVGIHYEEQPVQTDAPMVWLNDLNIGLGLWNGYFEGLPGPWLRWCDADGNWYLTDTEKAEAEKAEAQQKADRLSQRLKELGVDPDLI
ncbi:MAG: Uma2 family endonuclease [Cyanobacteria bacterium P01_H01_bin.21]